MKNVQAHAIGKEIASIDVRISYRIIQLFSEGLYSSPNKAVEELVSNSFDAGAINLHVILSTDLKPRREHRCDRRWGRDGRKGTTRPLAHRRER